MQTITMVLVMLLAVVVSAFVARLLPFKLPLPLVQIVIGALLSLATDFDVVLDPHIFFLLFIPPLLFLDGWRIPKGAFFRDLGPIVMLALGLVVFTVLGMGLLISWMIPAMPLAVAFALAAILSPTDPVAVSAIASGSPIPPRLMHILEGESLLNDASGLVCFRFAVAAALTGSFSATEASLDFVRVAGGGILIGVAVAWGITQINKLLLRRAGEEPGIQILISLLVPFAAYLAAEEVAVSGILAAAAAGISSHYADLSGRASATTRIQRHVVWDTVQLALNGIIFVLLGEQLPRIARSGPMILSQAGLSHLWQLSAYALLITLALIALRFLWVWVSLRLTLFRKQPQPESSASLRIPLLTAFAGVRGAITLAGILTLPLTMSDGSAFPARDLVIALAMGVILCSLLLATVAVPMCARGIEFLPQPAQARKEPLARSTIAQAALSRLEQVYKKTDSEAGKIAQEYPEAVTQVVNLYRRRLAYGESGDVADRHAEAMAQAERGLRLEALQAERDELYRLRISHQIDDTLHRKLVREIDLIESALSDI